MGTIANNSNMEDEEVVFKAMMTRDYWQANRHECAKGCGVGKALDQWNAGEPRTLKGLLSQVTRCNVLEKALEEARKANRFIRDQNTINVLNDYDSEILEKRRSLKKCVALKNRFAESVIISEIIFRYDRFENFIKSEFSYENLDFLRWIVDKGTMQEEKIAKLTIETYIAEDSPHMINISHNVRNPLLEQAEASDYENMDFESAYREVEALVGRDTYQRFKYQVMDELIDGQA